MTFVAVERPSNRNLLAVVTAACNRLNLRCRHIDGDEAPGAMSLRTRGSMNLLHMHAYAQVRECLSVKEVSQRQARTNANVTKEWHGIGICGINRGIRGNTAGMGLKFTVVPHGLRIDGIPAVVGTTSTVVPLEWGLPLPERYIIFGATVILYLLYIFV